MPTPRVCKKCMVCLKNKRSYSPKQPLNPIKLSCELPRAMIAFDVATLPWTKDGCRHVLIIVDLFSKYIEAIPMKKQTAQSIIEALESGWLLRHGYPVRTFSDQGPNVDGHLVRQLCQQLGIQNCHSTPYHPQGDGEAERSFQSFKQSLRCQLAEKGLCRTDWPKLLQETSFITMHS